MARKKSILVIGIFCLIALAFLMHLRICKIPVAQSSKDIVVNVAEKEVGFNLENETLNFGTLPKGSTATRQIIISNNDEGKLYMLKVEGVLKDWIYFSENNFVLKNESKTVEIVINVPTNISVGNYTSKLIISAYRPC